MSGQYVDMGREIHFSFKKKLYTAKMGTDPAFEEVRKHLEAGDYESAVKTLKVNTKEEGDLVIKKDAVIVKATAENKVVETVRLGEAYQEAYMYAKAIGKASVEILDLFFKNVALNPNKDSRDDLASFLAYSHMPITDRGTFLAYRYVSDNFFDCHTGRMDNMIGNDVSMPREKCNSDRNETCSTGLHVCHHGYLGSSRTVVVAEINPRDVVAVPTDYSRQKMRCCRFRPLCTLDYFKQQLLLTEQAALGKVPVFMTEQTRNWEVLEGVPYHMHKRYKPVDAWEWAKA